MISFSWMKFPSVVQVCWEFMLGCASIHGRQHYGSLYCVEEIDNFVGAILCGFNTLKMELRCRKCLLYFWQGNCIVSFILLDTPFCYPSVLLMLFCYICVRDELANHNAETTDLTNKLDRVGLNGFLMKYVFIFQFTLMDSCSYSI